MKTNRFIFFFCFLFIAAPHVSAADFEKTQSDTTMNDFTGRVGVELDFRLARHLSLGIENSIRFKDDFKSFDRNYLTGSLAYKPVDYFKLGAGYTFMSILHDGKKSTGYEKYWDLRHRAHMDVTGILPVGQWTFSLRERALATFRTPYYNPLKETMVSFDPLEKVSPEFSLRSRLEVEYSGRKLPLSPYYSFELCNTLNVPDFVGRNYIDKIRNMAGLKWRLTKRSWLDFFYRFDIETGKDVNIDYKKDDVTIEGVDVRIEKSYTHIFGITYSFDCR